MTTGHFSYDRPTGPQGPAGPAGPAGGEALVLPADADDDALAAGWYRLAANVGPYLGLHVRKDGLQVQFQGVTDGAGTVDTDSGFGPGGITIPDGFAPELAFGQHAFIIPAWSWRYTTGEVAGCHLSYGLVGGIAFQRAYGLGGANVIIVGWENVVYRIPTVAALTPGFQGAAGDTVTLPDEIPVDEPVDVAGPDVD